jgi:hypothetical protein
MRVRCRQEQSPTRSSSSSVMPNLSRNHQCRGGETLNQRKATYQQALAFGVESCDTRRLARHWAAPTSCTVSTLRRKIYHRLPSSNPKILSNQHFPLIMQIQITVTDNRRARVTHQSCDNKAARNRNVAITRRLNANRVFLKDNSLLCGDGKSLHWREPTRKKIPQMPLLCFPFFQILHSAIHAYLSIDRSENKCNT